MYEFQELLDLMVFVISKGFLIAGIAGFISWGFWYVVGMFRSVSSSGN